VPSDNARRRLGRERKADIERQERIPAWRLVAVEDRRGPLVGQDEIGWLAQSL